MYESIRDLYLAWGLKGPIISYNGAMTHRADGSLVSHHPVDPSVVAEIVDFAEREDLPLNFYTDGVVLSKRFQPWWDLYEGRTCSPMREVESLLPYKARVASKLLILSEPKRILELQAELQPRFEGRAQLMVTMDEYLEVMAPLVNKGRAVRELAASMGFGLDEVAAAGDGFNDIEMLEEAGLAVTVSSGREALKALADLVVAPPADCGVADFIEAELL